MQKVLVTGATGYIGSHTVVALIEAGMVPVLIDNFSNSEPWIRERIAAITGITPIFYHGDCTDAAFVDSVFTRESDITAVIHLAALKSVADSIAEPLAYYKNNLDATLTILEVMQQHEVNQLVFSSSATVYGELATNPISETEPRKVAASPYGQTKAMGEAIIEAVSHTGTLKAVSLRYFNPIGAHPSAKIGESPRGVPNNLVPYLMQVAAGVRDSVTVFGTDYSTVDGSCVRDYIHVVDVAQAHVAALQYLARAESPAYDAFNIGTGQGTSVLQLIKAFETATNLPVPYQAGARRPGDLAEYYGDVQKIREVMGWQSTHSLETALKDAWRWQQTLPSEEHNHQ